MAGCVLDTSALVAVFQGEPGAEQVVSILAPAAQSEGSGAVGSAPPPPVYVPFMALMELDDLTRQRVGGKEARRVCSLVQAWPVEIVESNERWRLEAARIKAAFTLSLADAWISSLAILHQAQLVHKDPEYDQVTALESLRLPYKTGG